MRMEFTKRIKRDAFVRAEGNCEGCGARLTIGKYHYDHIIPDGLGGQPILDNCAVLCIVCHKIKTTTKDIPLIAKTKRIQDKHHGIRTAPRKKIQSAGFRKAPPQKSASRPIERRS